MSSHIVEVCVVEEITAHANADRLELARVKGWWCVVPKGTYVESDKVVYIPPDSVLKEELAEKWGVAKYLSPLAKNPDGTRPDGLRVRASRFRGEKSFGMIQEVEDESWEVGRDVKEHYDITKYDPPLKATDGDAAPQVPAFHAYTNIENFQNFPNIFKEGEVVFIDEKIHGTNCRLGLINYPHPDTGVLRPTFMAGSHAIRRLAVRQNTKTDKRVESRYWKPLRNGNVVDLLETLYRDSDRKNIVVFGEIFGPGVQDMHYGQKCESFRVFDITIDGKYMNFEARRTVCERANVPVTPFLYQGPFSVAKIEELVDGETYVCDKKEINQPFKGREGIVIRPEKERFNADIGGDGRVILKCVSVDYHERKNKNQTEDH